MSIDLVNILLLHNKKIRETINNVVMKKNLNKLELETNIITIPIYDIDSIYSSLYGSSATLKIHKLNLILNYYVKDNMYNFTFNSVIVNVNDMLCNGYNMYDQLFKHQDFKFHQDTFKKMLSLSLTGDYCIIPEKIIIK